MMVRFFQFFFNKAVFAVGRMRGCFWGLFCKKVGKNFFLMKGCYVMGPSGVEIGNNVSVNRFTTISGQGGLKIGSNVMIGPNCNILTSNHGYDDLSKPMMEQGTSMGTIVIDDDVWLGANVVILPNITIGKGAIVGANAVVTKNVEPFSIVGGVPARHIKYRFSSKSKEVKGLD